jgi:hypothetical protein
MVLARDPLLPEANVNTPNEDYWPSGVGTSLPSPPNLTYPDTLHLLST